LTSRPEKVIKGRDMQIAITIEENKGMDSKTSSIFGRCEYFMFIDPETEEFTTEENPAKNARGGAGIQAAQLMVDNAISIVISGHLGPKAHAVLFNAGIAAYQFQGRTVREALEAYNEKTLTSLFEPDVSAHSGQA